MLQASVYVNPERVTDDLVADYLGLAENRPAAVEVVTARTTTDQATMAAPTVGRRPRRNPSRAPSFPPVGLPRRRGSRA